MRLWHKDLVNVLPREQLVAQWRECSAIAGAIQKNGTPNHVLVNYVLDDINSFVRYSYMVRQIMTKRGYKTMDSVWNKIIALTNDTAWAQLTYNQMFAKEHDLRYLTQCYYNLQEKYDRGGISSEEWDKIEKKMSEVFG